MAETELVAALERQLAKYDAAIAEFTAIDAQLRTQPVSARVADMIRVNRETINAIERSVELLNERLGAARMLTTTGTRCSSSIARTP